MSRPCPCPSTRSIIATGGTGLVAVARACGRGVAWATELASRDPSKWAETCRQAGTHEAMRFPLRPPKPGKPPKPKQPKETPSE